MNLNLDRVGWASASRRRRALTVGVTGAALAVLVLVGAAVPAGPGGLGPVVAAGLAAWLLLPMALPISGRRRWHTEGPPVVLLAAGLAGCAALSGSLLPVA